MYLFPYIKKRFRTPLSPERIVSILEKKIIQPAWKLDAGKLFDSTLMSGRIRGNEFELARGAYYFTIGRNSLWPKMTGKIRKAEKNNTTRVAIKIHPPVTGSIILSFFYLLAAVILVNSLKGAHTEVVITISLFFITTYSGLMITFNRTSKKYLRFLKTEINAIEEH